uniref:Family with sequence similarity 168 member A n=1 Tax=Equus caballus TaxID=9796 RepID=A0A9L0SB10_HORSE
MATLKTWPIQVTPQPTRQQPLPTIPACTPPIAPVMLQLLLYVLRAINASTGSVQNNYTSSRGSAKTAESLTFFSGPCTSMTEGTRATLLMKQAWPQNSSSCGTEGTFHLPVDTGTENRTYQASSAAFRYTAGTPYKVPPTQSNTAPPPYSPSPNPYQTAMYPIRSAYPQQNLYAQGAYYTQPVYAAQPHVIHHTTVVQPNSIPSAIYPAPVAAPRTNGVAMGMVAGTTMAMSAGTLLTAPQHTAIGAHPVSMPTYRAQGTPAYSYVPPHW